MVTPNLSFQGFASTIINSNWTLKLRYLNLMRSIFTKATIYQKHKEVGYVLFWVKATRNQKKSAKNATRKSSNWREIPEISLWTRTRIKRTKTWCLSCRKPDTVRHAMHNIYNTQALYMSVWACVYVRRNAINSANWLTHIQTRPHTRTLTKEWIYKSRGRYHMLMSTQCQ